MTSEQDRPEDERSDGDQPLSGMGLRLEVWPKSHARSMVPELLTNRRVADKRQIAISATIRAETFVEMIAPGWLRSRMRPVLVATSVRLETVAAISSWKSVLVRPT